MPLAKTEIQEIIELRNQGLGFKQIARKVGTAPNTVKKYCRVHHVNAPEPEPSIEEDYSEPDQLSPVVRKKTDQLECARKEVDIFKAEIELQDAIKEREELEEKEWQKLEAKKKREEWEAKSRAYRAKEREELEGWLASYKERGLKKLASLFEEHGVSKLSTAKNTLDLKAKIEEALRPLYRKENDEVISKFLEELVSDFFNDLSKDPAFKKLRREHLLKIGNAYIKDRLLWGFFFTSGGEREELEAELIAALHKNVKGNESVKSVKWNIDKYIEAWKDSE